MRVHLPAPVPLHLVVTWCHCNTCSCWCGSRSLVSYATTGFLLNLRFLRAVFGPELVLHGVRRTGSNELTCRWTMRMTVQARVLHAKAVSCGAYST
jgi:hypothetical protein